MVAAQRPALQLPLRRLAKTVKMRTISRAEGGQLQAPVGWHGSAHDHVPLTNKPDAMTFRLGGHVREQCAYDMSMAR